MRVGVRAPALAAPRMWPELVRVRVRVSDTVRVSGVGLTLTL